MSTPLVTIDNCASVQVLPTQDVPLASGSLELLSVVSDIPDQSAPAPHSADVSTPILTLKLGNAAFPINKATTFYTHTSSSRWYIFSPALDEKALGAGTYVKIILPEEISIPGSEAEKARDAFEEVLLNHGLLQDGGEAVVDELAASARDAGKDTAEVVEGMAKLHTSGPPAEPTTFSPTTHSAVDSTVSGTATLQSYTSSASRTMASVGTSLGQSAGAVLFKASETVAKAGVAVGERLVHLFGMDDQVERVASTDGGSKFDNSGVSGTFDAPKSDVETPAAQDVDQQIMEDERKYGDGTGGVVKSVTKAVGEVGAGIKEGVSTATSATKDAATSVLEHDAGSEAVELMSKSGEAAGNVRQATTDVALATSAIATAGYVAAGARDGTPAEGESAKDGPSTEGESAEQDKGESKAGEGAPAPAEPVRH